MMEFNVPHAIHACDTRTSIVVPVRLAPPKHAALPSLYTYSCHLFAYTTTLGRSFRSLSSVSVPNPARKGRSHGSHPSIFLRIPFSPLLKYDLSHALSRHRLPCITRYRTTWPEPGLALLSSLESPIHCRFRPHAAHHLVLCPARPRHDLFFRCCDVSADDNEEPGAACESGEEGERSAGVAELRAAGVVCCAAVRGKLCHYAYCVTSVDIVFEHQH